jgi:hypothetical protein
VELKILAPPLMPTHHCLTVVSYLEKFQFNSRPHTSTYAHTCPYAPAFLSAAQGETKSLGERLEVTERQRYQQLQQLEVHTQQLLLLLGGSALSAASPSALAGGAAATGDLKVPVTGAPTEKRVLQEQQAESEAGGKGSASTSTTATTATATTATTATPAARGGEVLPLHEAAAAVASWFEESAATVAAAVTSVVVPDSGEVAISKEVQTAVTGGRPVAQMDRRQLVQALEGCTGVSPMRPSVSICSLLLLSSFFSSLIPPSPKPLNYLVIPKQCCIVMVVCRSD